MSKIKVTTAVVNRGGKRYVAKDWVIEVSDADLNFFDGFNRVEVKKNTPKKIKDEDNK